MRFTSHCLIVLLIFGVPLASVAGPQTSKQELDLDILDMNGTPFRTFHLGLYAKGLDNQRMEATAELPTDQLKQDSSPALQGDSARYTGVSAEPVSTLSYKPDISPLLNAYDEMLLKSGGAF